MNFFQTVFWLAIPLLTGGMVTGALTGWLPISISAALSPIIFMATFLVALVGVSKCVEFLLLLSGGDDE